MISAKSYCEPITKDNVITIFCLSVLSASLLPANNVSNVSPNFPQLPSITKTQFTENLCPPASSEARVYDLFYLV